MAERRPDRARGPRDDEFWAWCDKEELRLQQCAHCHRFSWPVVARACECCGSERLSWERVSGRGQIVSWCTFERDYYAGLLPLPWETILVELEEGPLFISNPLHLARSDIKRALPVRVAFLACEDTAGHFKLPVFSKA